MQARNTHIHMHTDIVHTCMLISFRQKNEYMKICKEKKHLDSTHIPCINGRLLIFIDLVNLKSHSEPCTQVYFLWSVLTWLEWMLSKVWFCIITTIHTAHSLTFGLHPLIHPYKHTDTCLVRHSESAQLVCSFLTLSLASFPRPGFTLLCTLHISKSHTSLWTSMCPAQKITANA